MTPDQPELPPEEAPDAPPIPEIEPGEPPQELPPLQPGGGEYGQPTA